jgi:ubiquinone/menaquinone biosynthesis C-methylase UbiE
VLAVELEVLMPTIEENRSVWNDTYHWSQSGDEWSGCWGSAHMQWYGSILPRISAFVPVDTILEIAPGYGRWTAFLKSLCKRLIIVDLSEKCIEICKQRFGHCSHISYYVNDGKSLDMVGDGTVDFIFSFDSLVHAEDIVLKAYAAEFSKKLGPDGTAFIHHSNLGEYITRLEMQSWIAKIPKLLGLMRKLGFCDNLSSQWRATTMTAAKMALFAEQYGLQCASQELVNWESKFVLIDCLSTIVRHKSQWARENRVFRNRGFMAEAKNLSELGHLYERTPPFKPHYRGSGRKSRFGLALKGLAPRKPS